MSLDFDFDDLEYAGEPLDPLADPDCRYCGGSGEIRQSHGDGFASEVLLCQCVREEMPAKLLGDLARVFAAEADAALFAVRDDHDHEAIAEVDRLDAIADELRQQRDAQRRA